MSRFNYNDEDMKTAIEAVKKGSPIATAAKTFKVPRMTLSDKCKGKTPIQRKMGPPSILSETEEGHLVRWIFYLGSRGFPITSCQLLDSVQMLLKSQKKSNPFSNNRPGRHWLEAFQKRHPELATRVSQNLTKSRASVSEVNIRWWFEEITEYFKQNNMLDVCNDPVRVFNCDETAFFLSPGNNRVLVRKGQKMVHSVTNSDEKENITTLVMGNAEGDLAPPMVVVNLKRVPKSFAASMPESWAIGRSDNGWMTGQTFFEYITNVFYPWLVEKSIPLPVILYLDGHASHLTLPLSEFCKDKGIEIVALYPNSTHFLQPMDVAIFHPLKVAWKKEVYKWRIENAGVRLKRDNFSLLLHKVLKNTLKPEMLKNGFRACGLLPLNPDALDYFKVKAKEDKVPKSTLLKNVEDIKKHLKYIESLIPQEKLQLFKESGPTWSHEVEYTELFKIWLKIKKNINEEVTETEHENQEDVMSSLDNEQFDDMLIDMFPENELVDFAVGEGGTLQKITNEDTYPLLYSPVSTTAESGQEVIIIESDYWENLTNSEILTKLSSANSTNQLNQTTTEPEPSTVTQNDKLLDISITGTEESSIPSTEIQNHDLPVALDESTEKNILVNLLATTESEAEVNQAAPSDKVIVLNESSPIQEKPSAINMPVNLFSPATEQAVNQDTPIKKNMTIEESLKNKEKDILVDIPSPFKHNLFWPDTPKVTKKLKEKIPSVATSKDWQEYYRKKEDKKLEKEQEIKERKRKRLANKENKKQSQEKVSKKKKEEPKLNSEEQENGNLLVETNQKETWYCSICEEDRQEDMIKCQKCVQWMHEKCASISKKTTKFVCQVCKTLF